MTTYQNVFGGTVVYPAEVSYRAVSLTADTELSWPTELATNTNVVSKIMNVTATSGPWDLIMPPANEASVGETALIFNVGSNAFVVTDNGGNTIVSIAPGLAYQLFLTDNSTVNGTWGQVQYGAGTSSATAGSLAGLGVKAIGTTLNQSMTVSTISVNYAFTVATDRSGAFVWTGGAGTLTLPLASNAGNDWFVHIRNGGTGAITLTPSGSDLINGDSNLIFNPGDSAIIACSGTAWYSIGFGQPAEFTFDYDSIDLSSESTPYALSGANLNRIAYSFGGAIASNFDIIVPTTVQQYWVTNNTTGGFSLVVKTAAGTGVTVAVGESSILYCNGTNVVDADTAGVAYPISIANGGTGATNATDARANLSAAKSGVNGDITQIAGLNDGGASGPAVTFLSESNTGLYRSAAGSLSFSILGTLEATISASGLNLTSGNAYSINGSSVLNATTLGSGVTASSLTSVGTLTSGALGSGFTTVAVGQGGTGITTATTNGVVYGNGTSALGVTAAGTTGQVLVGNTGGAPSWTALSGIGVTSISFGTTGLTPSTATQGAITVAGTLAEANGGTGQSSYTIGDLLYASGSTTLSKLADVATGNALISGGVGAAPAWGKIGLTTHVSGTLDVGNGGTGATTFTSNGVLYGNGTSAVSVTAAGTTGQVLVANTGGAPSWATLTGIGVTSFSAGTTGLTPSTGTTGAITLAGTLGVANGGTGATSLTSGYLVKGNGTSAASASVVYDDGTNVGIGTTAPGAKLNVVDNSASDALRITQTGAGNALVVEDDTSPDASPFVVKASGNVGIGTSAPTDLLHLSKGAGLGIILERTGGTPSVASISNSANLLTLSTNGPGGLSFNTGSTPAERARFDPNGNFLFATTTSSASSTANGLAVLQSNSSILSRRESGASQTHVNFVNGGSSVGTIVTSTTAATYNTSGTSGITGVDANTVAIRTNSTERMRIDASGNVGIGTSSPGAKLNVVDASANDALRITQTGAGNALVVEDSANPDSTPFVVRNNGQVLARQTADYSISGGDFAFQASSTGGANGNSGYAGYNWANNSFANGVSMFKSRGNSLGTQGIVSSGDTLGVFRAYGSDGTAFIEAASITSAVDGTPGSNDMPGRLMFSTTADGAASPTERMRIDASGNVGIGTSSPGSPLDVQKVQNAATVIQVANTDAGASASARLVATNGTTTGGVIMRGTGNTEANYLVIYNSSTTAPVSVYTNGSERMRVTSAGDVGINESAPDYKLDVNGTFGFSPGASVTPVDNGDVVFELTNNTTLTIKAKGSDGVVRSGTITLA